MVQINLKLSENEYTIIQTYAERNNLPMASALRTIISEPFNAWKIEYLITEYCTGRLGFKKAWKLSGLSFNVWLRHLEESDAELNLAKIIEQKAEEVASSLDPKDFQK